MSQLQQQYDSMIRQGNNNMPLIRAQLIHILHPHTHTLEWNVFVQGKREHRRSQAQIRGRYTCL